VVSFTICLLYPLGRPSGNCVGPTDGSKNEITTNTLECSGIRSGFRRIISYVCDNVYTWREAFVNIT